MPKPSEGPDNFCHFLADDELCAELDAEVAAMAVEDLPPLPDVDVPADADRSHLKWIWAEPSLGETQVRTAEASEAPPTAPGKTILRFPSYVVGAALAASLLIAFGALLATRFDGGEAMPLAFAVTLGQDVVRGAEAVGSLTVQNRSNSKAFVTVVGLRDGGTPVVHYRENQRFIDVIPNGTRVIGNLPGSFDEVRAMLVVLTTTPAGEAVRQIAGAGEFSGETPKVAKESLLGGLEALGFTESAAEVVTPDRNIR